MSALMIVSDPKVMMGKPVVAGTRVTVDLILEKLGSSHPGAWRATCARSWPSIWWPKDSFP
jgi:hypothetical protein